MKIALTPAVLLGFTGLTAAFPCYWNGDGSSYVYTWADTTTGGGYCMTAIDTDHYQTTCCRCASTADCDALGDVTTPDYGDHGCDLYAPRINIRDSAGGASLPAQWFTSQAQLMRYLSTTVECVDDCVLEPSCEIAVTYVNNANKDLCGNTIVTVTSSDWIGCNNMNTASRNFLVRYDDKPPVVTVNLGEFAYKPLPKEKLEQVPLSIGISDNCDLYPEVTITVFSDEVGLSEDHTDADAILARRYSNNSASGVNAGWDLWLDRKRYAVKQCEHELACQIPDGRFYTVRVCAKDLAGWTTCAEDTIGVPLKASLDKTIDPINQGKLFVVATDTVWWGQQPDQMGYRARNVDLDVTNTVIPNANFDARLCWSNRDVDTASAIGSPYSNVQGPDRCAVICAGISGCVGFNFLFQNFGTGYGTCQLYSGITDMDTFISSNNNLYMMDGYGCPPLAGGTP